MICPGTLAAASRPTTARGAAAANEAAAHNDDGEPTTLAQARSAHVEREDGEEVRGFPDPAGGTFDAAGDFDRVLPEGDESFAVLKLVDRDSDTVLNVGHIEGLLADIDRLSALALKPVERRGLDRLRVMAEGCRKDPTLHLRFIGD